MAATPETSPRNDTHPHAVVGREVLNMKNSILSVFPQLRRFALRPFFPCIVAACLCWGASPQPRAKGKGSRASHAAGWVVIPVEEYRVLRAKAYPVEHDPEPPPLDATLTRVDYDLHVAGDLAAGRASLTVDVLKDGWVRVPVPAGLLVREARLDGKLVSLVPGDRERADGISRRCSRTPDAPCCCSMSMFRSRPPRATRAFRCPRRNRE